MPHHLIDLDARLTHQYVTGWAGEDQWVSLARVRSTGPTLLSQDDEGSASTRVLLTFAPKDWEQAKAVYRRQNTEPRVHRVSLVRWLAWMARDNFSTGCRHEHDCCGCRLTSASAHYIGKRRFSVELHHYHNV